MDPISFAPRPSAELRTLGVAALRVGGAPRLERRRKALAVLAFLARQAPTRLRRADLAPLFWPGSPEERARQSLRQALAELRHAIGDAVQSTSELAWIEPTRIVLDIEELERDMDAGRIEAALARHGGPFLEGYEGVGGAPFDLWLTGERERLAARVAWLEARRDSPRSRDDDRPPGTPGAATPPRYRRAPMSNAPLRSTVPLATTADQGTVLRELCGAWNRACQGGREALLLEGDAGLGKSHVLEQFVRTARTAQPQSVVLVARALESERRQPGALLRQLLATAPSAAIVHAETAADDARRLCDVAARCAGVVPLLVVVDDATLADDGGQDALGALIEAPPSGALVVLAARPFMLSEVRFRAALQRNASLRRMALAAMRPDAVAELLQSLLPLDGTLANALAERLADERRGNPGLIDATMTAMLDDGYLVAVPDGRFRLARELPTRLPIAADARERTRRQLPRLSSEARLVLELAAIPGDAVEVSLLAVAAEVDERALATVLHELAARRLLRPSVRGDGWLEFHSGAVRHAVLDLMGLPRRRTLQRVHERALRQRAGGRTRDRITYAPAPRTALGVLRSTLDAAGLLG